MRIYIKLETSCIEEEWDGEDYGEWHSSHSFDDVFVFANKASGYYDEVFDCNIEVGDTVYVVIEDSSSGDSFGHCDHGFEVEGCFASLEEAEAFCSNEKNKTCGYFDEHNEWIIARRPVSESRMVSINGVRYA